MVPPVLVEHPRVGQPTTTNEKDALQQIRPGGPASPSLRHGAPASPIDVAAQWSGQPQKIIGRIDLSPHEITIHIALSSFFDGESGLLVHVVPVRIRRRGTERRLVLRPESNARDRSHLGSAMIKGVARAPK